MAVSAFQKILNRLFKQFVNLNGREPMTPKEWMNIQNEAVQFFNRTKGVTTPKKEPFQGFKPKVIEGGKGTDEEVLFKAYDKFYDKTGRMRDKGAAIVEEGLAGLTKKGDKKPEIDVEIWKKQKKAENDAAIKRFKEKTKKTVEDFRDEGDWDPSGFASGGIAPLVGEPTYAADFYDNRIPYAGGGKAGLPAITPGMQGPQMPAPAPQPAGISGAGFLQNQQDMMNQRLQQNPFMQQMQHYGGQFRKAFEKGGMSRRGFLKLLGGLGALPFLGKYFKAAKTAAPAVEAGIETIKRTAGGIPDYAYNLIEVVKNKGVMELIEGIYKRNPTAKKYTYKGVEVIEDGLGNTSVRKEQTKTGSWNDPVNDDTIVDDYVDREIGFEIRKGDDIVKDEGLETQKAIRGADEYNESTAYMQGDPDGGMDVSEIAEQIEIEDHLDLKEIADEIYIKKASGGVARLLGE